MQITVTKITTLADAHRAIEATMPDGFAAKATLADIYRWDHSITRSQLFWVEVEGAPAFVQGHLTRHKIGVEWFCQSRRSDRCGQDGTEINRLTPVNFSMLVNAEALMQMARKRLCYKASPETREVLMAIKDGVADVDPALSRHMVPQCVYRGGCCPEPKPCGKYLVRRYDPVAESRRVMPGNVEEAEG